MTREKKRWVGTRREREWERERNNDGVEGFWIHKKGKERKNEKKSENHKFINCSYNTHRVYTHYDDDARGRGRERESRHKKAILMLFSSSLNDYKIEVLRVIIVIKIMREWRWFMTWLWALFRALKKFFFFKLKFLTKKEKIFLKSNHPSCNQYRHTYIRLPILLSYHTLT